MLVQSPRLRDVLDTINSIKAKGQHQTYASPFINTVWYLNGQQPPNHPVPAIIYDVDICRTWDNEVHVWDVNSYTSVAEWSNRA